MRATLITLSLALLLPIAASATTYDLVGEYSSTSNPNGQFFYGYGLPGGGQYYTFNGNNLFGQYAFNYWAITANSLPALGYSAAGVQSGTVDVPGTQLFLHPGNAPDEDSVLGFYAPTTGSYSIDATFTHDDTANAGTGQSVGVYVDGVDLGSATLGTAYGDSFGFAASLSLNAGEFVVFDVARTGNDYSYDSTGLSGSIIGPSATPEPSSLVLLGTGILGLAGTARRKLCS